MEWISVDDHLPDEAKLASKLCKQKEWLIFDGSEFGITDEHPSWWNRAMGNTVTHWIPLRLPNGSNGDV